MTYNITVPSQQVRLVTAAGVITHVITDNIIVVKKTTGAPTTVNLIASPKTGQTVTVKDGNGDAATNNITISPNTGTIDGATGVVLRGNYAEVVLVYNSIEWSVTSSNLISIVSVPPQAAAVGYNTLTFGPNIIIGTGAFTGGANWQHVSGASFVQNTDGSLTMSGQPSGASNFQFFTANAGSGGNFTGRTFGGGAYIEAIVSIGGGTPQVTAAGWPSFWSEDVEMQSGNTSAHWSGQATGYNNWCEVDFFELNSGATAEGVAYHNWYGTLPSPPKADLNVHSPISFGTPAPNLALPHKYGYLWVMATSTTQGFWKIYFDDVLISTSVGWDLYNPALAPPPAGTNIGSVLDTRHLLLIMGTSPTNPMTVNSVKIWQASNATNDFRSVS